MKENRSGYEIEFSIETGFGRITVLYDYQNACEKFESDFRNCTRRVGNKNLPDAQSWQTAVGEAEKNLEAVWKFGN